MKYAMTAIQNDVYGKQKLLSTVTQQKSVWMNPLWMFPLFKTHKIPWYLQVFFQQMPGIFSIIIKWLLNLIESKSTNLKKLFIQYWYFYGTQIYLFTLLAYFRNLVDSIRTLVKYVS